MKYMKKMLIVFVVALLMITSSVQVFADQVNQPEVISQSDQGTSKYMSWDLITPQIKGLDSRRAERTINKELSQTVKRFKKETLVEAKIAYRESKQSEYPFRPFQAQTVYQVHVLNPNLLSLTMDMYQYTGGAHGMTVRKPFNYNLKTGKMLGYQDLFKECVNYRQVIVHHVMDQIIKNPDVYFEDAAETVKAFTDQQPFYITEEGIVVIYGLYEIAPYAAGIQEFLIPFSAFQCS